MVATVSKLPYSVGKFSLGYLAMVVVLLALIGVGAYAYSQQVIEGDIVTGMRDIGTRGGAAWGIYIVFMLFSIGVGVAGISIVALARVMNVTALQPLVRTAEVLSIVALMVGMLAVMADIGNPVRGFINLMRYGRPQSPFFGTMTLSVAYLIATFVYLYLDGRRDAALCARVSGKMRWFYRLWAAGYKDTPTERARHDRAVFWLAISILVLVVVYHATVGFVFGTQVARPGWFTPLLSLWHLNLNAASGVGGVLIITAAVLRVVLREKDRLNIDVFRVLGLLMMFFIATFLFIWAIETMTSTYEAPNAETRATAAALTGPYAWITWLSLGLMVLAFFQLFGQYVARRYSLPIIVESAVLVTIAAFLQRYVLVLPSQTHGTLLPYGAGSYAPTFVEYGVIVGLLAIGVLLFAVFTKIFPILEMTHSEGGTSDA